MSFTRVAPTRCTPRATQILERFLSDIRQQNPPAGTRSYLRGRVNLPSAAGVECAHAPDMLRGEKSPHVRCTGGQDGRLLSYMYIYHWSVVEPRRRFLSRALANLPFWVWISRWLEAREKLPRFHRRALLDVSRHPTSEIPPTGCLPVANATPESREIGMAKCTLPTRITHMASGVLCSELSSQTIRENWRCIL
jgi:hypothetical protein